MNLSLTPRDSLTLACRQALTWATLTLAPGAYAPFTIERPRPLSIVGHGAVIDGAPQDAIKISNSVGIIITGIEVRRAGRMGIMVVDSGEIALVEVIADDCHVNGILFGGLKAGSQGATVQRCKARRNGGHGIYLSEKGSRWLVEDCEITDNALCNLHLNAHPGHATDVQALRNDCRRCHAAAIQQAGVTGGRLANNLVDGTRVGVVLWPDQGGSAYAPRDIDCSAQDGTYLVSKHCERITLPPGVTPGRPEGE